MSAKSTAGRRKFAGSVGEAEAILARQCAERGITCGDPECTRPEHREPERGEVVRDASGAVLHGPSLPCGCPLDADCTGHNPGAL